MLKIQYKKFERLCRDLEDLEFDADEWVPSEDDMKIIEGDLKKYIKLLLWVQETGRETEENAEMRKRITLLLRNNLKVE